MSTWVIRNRGRGKVVYASAPDVEVPPVVLPPLFSIAPVITGTATEGQTLSVTTGVASGSPTYAVQWKRNGTNIIGATGSTYLLVSADVGTVFTVTSTATNTAGSVGSTSAATDAIAVAGGSSTANPALTAPILTLVSANGNGSSPSFDVGLSMNHGVGDTVRIYQRNKSGALINTFTNVIDLSEATDTSAGTNGKASFNLSSVSAGTWRWTCDVLKAGGATYGALSNKLIVGPDDQEPTLTLLSLGSSGSATVEVNFTTDEGNGTARTYVSTVNSAPSQATIDASTDSLAITTSGAKTISKTGLSIGTTYYAWVQHTDAVGNKSAITYAGTVTTANLAPSKMATAGTGLVLNGDYEVERTGVSGDSAALGTPFFPAATAYRYFEVSGQISSGGYQESGLGAASANLNVAPSAAGQASVVLNPNGLVRKNDTTLATIPSSADYNTWGFLLRGGKLYIHNGYGWGGNGNPAGMDPAAQTGGIDISTLGNVAPILEVYLQTKKRTVNFGQSAFVYAAALPAGVQAWNA